MLAETTEGSANPFGPEQLATDQVSGDTAHPGGRFENRLLRGTMQEVRRNFCDARVQDHSWTSAVAGSFGCGRRISCDSVQVPRLSGCIDDQSSSEIQHVLTPENSCVHVSEWLQRTTPISNWESDAASTDCS